MALRRDPVGSGRAHVTLRVLAFTPAPESGAAGGSLARPAAGLLDGCPRPR
ncbi:MAG TPA: hypothetical protein VNF91_00150 [Candidatus Acidoferrum sp.]|nr:hypothetical protein [Candidatus Acidoferrum sp.]